MGSIKSLAVAISSACLAVSGTAAIAADSAGIEEVIVTAQKRAQNLQDVPVSMVAFDANSLDKIGADSLEDLTLRTPNVSFEQFGDVRLSTPTIRGISGDNSGGLS